MDMNHLTGMQLLEGTIGLPKIEVISNEFKEFPAGNEEREFNTFHKIVFQIEEDDPDIYAVGVLFCLSLMSFTYAAPRGYSEMEFIPDEEYNLGYFIQGLSFEHRRLCFSGDYVSGRLMKTDIQFEPGGRVTLETRNRGKGADRWMIHLQGKKHIQVVDA